MGVSYRYLTASYVKWLGLEPMYFRTGRTVLHGGWGPARELYEPMVIHDGRAYVLEVDGLAFVRDDRAVVPALETREPRP